MNDIVAPLVAWYKQNGRRMPWRDDPTPYRVWVSEIMLQQTRVEAVMPYYGAFLDAFPTVRDLAKADDEKLMKLWQGLGYYARARHLKEAAVKMVEEYDGHLPPDAEKLRALPGVGDYTAGAVASIAFGLPEPAVDGNVLRVMMRLQNKSDNVLDPKTKKSVTDALRPLYPSGKEAGLLTQALMELGETVCVPGKPRCDVCPLADQCAAFASGTAENLPVRVKKNEKRTENRTVFILHSGSFYALRKRPERGLLAGLWEFVNTEGTLRRKDAEAFLRTLGLTVISAEKCGKTRHTFSHVVWNMTVYRVECAERVPSLPWFTADTVRADCAVPSAFAYCVERL